MVVPAEPCSAAGLFDPLAEVGGRSILSHTIQRAHESGASMVIVATECLDIARHVPQHGAMAVMVNGCVNDLERVAAAVTQLVDAKVIMASVITVSLPANEPLFPGCHIKQLVGDFDKRAADMATVAVQHVSDAQAADPGIVKTVTDKYGRALYFSRSSIPCMAGHQPNMPRSPAATGFARCRFSPAAPKLCGSTAHGA
ncbi:cytidylyltransferase domain-containing protein [Nissabacter sp. SGAir0207]|uniref:cytidylyltransferase domain-containing protein n=1 Tax=Nissabacter sp. SGAir0207 TaxID=2126321 RepID=UPI0010CD2900|nr:hypothetical protein [Nissabacter sp. SGAir0207]QCR38790.1 hypothetical protein C1N62_21950 [Nissabacter sp. SGAir0207]